MAESNVVGAEARHLEKKRSIAVASNGRFGNNGAVQLTLHSIGSGRSKHNMLSSSSLQIRSLRNGMHIIFKRSLQSINCYGHSGGFHPLLETPYWIAAHTSLTIVFGVHAGSPFL